MIKHCFCSFVNESVELQKSAPNIYNKVVSDKTKIIDQNKHNIYNVYIYYYYNFIDNKVDKPFSSRKFRCKRIILRKLNK